MHYVCALYMYIIYTKYYKTNALPVTIVHVQGMHMYTHTDKEKYDCVIAQIAHQNIHID